MPSAVKVYNGSCIPNDQYKKLFLNFLILDFAKNVCLTTGNNLTKKEKKRFHRFCHVFIVFELCGSDVLFHFVLNRLIEMLMLHFLYRLQSIDTLIAC